VGAVVAFFALAGTAQAAPSIVGVDGATIQHYQRWVDSALAPSPDVKVTVYPDTTCPGEPVIPKSVQGDLLGGVPEECTLQSTSTIYLYVNPSMEMSYKRGVFLHAMGHIFDAQLLEGTWIRDWMFELLSKSIDLPADDPDLLDEWIAEGWAMCARHRRLSGYLLDEDFRYSDTGPYDYRPNARLHRRMCVLIRVAASADRTQSGYTKALKPIRRCEHLRRKPHRPAWVRREHCLRRIGY